MYFRRFLLFFIILSAYLCAEVYVNKEDLNKEDLNKENKNKENKNKEDLKKENKNKEDLKKENKNKENKNKENKNKENKNKEDLKKENKNKEAVKKTLLEIKDILLSDVAFSAFLRYFNIITSFMKAKNSNEINEEDLKEILNFLKLEDGNRKAAIADTLVEKVVSFFKPEVFKSVPELIKSFYNLFTGYKDKNDKKIPEKIADILPEEISPDKISIQEYYDTIGKERKEDLVVGVIERCIDNVQVNEIRVIKKVQREELRDEILKGKFENIPKDMCIEDEFVDFVLKYKSEVTVDEYNNLAEFISIVKKNKKVDYIKEMQEKVSGRYFFINKEINWISLIYHGGNYFVKNYDEIVKELAEIKKEADKLEDKVDVEKSEPDNSKVNAILTP
jgi:hypothetical protein